MSATFFPLRKWFCFTEDSVSKGQRQRMDRIKTHSMNKCEMVRIRRTDKKVFIKCFSFVAHLYSLWISYGFLFFLSIRGISNISRKVVTDFKTFPIIFLWPRSRQTNRINRNVNKSAWNLNLIHIAATMIWCNVWTWVGRVWIWWFPPYLRRIKIFL